MLSSVPSFLFLGEGKIGADLAREIRLTNSTKQSIRIRTLTSASGKLKFSHFPDLLAAGDSMKLMVTLTPEAPGTFKDELRIETDNSVQPTVRIGVAAVVRAQK